MSEQRGRRVHHLPQPTVWPAILATGVSLMLWGLITNYAVSGAGVILFIISAAGWVKDILDEAAEHHGAEDGQP